MSNAHVALRLTNPEDEDPDALPLPGEVTDELNRALDESGWFPGDWIVDVYNGMVKMRVPPPNNVNELPAVTIVLADMPVMETDTFGSPFLIILAAIRNNFPSVTFALSAVNHP